MASIAKCTNERVLSPKRPESAGPKQLPGIISSTEPTTDESQPLLPCNKRWRPWSPPIRKYVPVEIVVSAYFFTVVLSLPLLEFYLFDKVAEQYGGVNKSSSSPCSPGADNSSSLAHEVQTKSSEYIIFLIFTSSFPGIVQTFVFGALSDRQGRRTSLFWAFSGMIVRQIIHILVFVLDLPILYLFIGNFLEGLTGGFGTVLTAIFGIVADITTAGPKRAFRISLVQAVMAISSSVGMLLSGIWIDQAGFKQPLFFVMCLMVADLLFTIFVLPETRRNQSKERVSIKEHLKSIRSSFQLYTKDNGEGRRWKLLICLFTFTTTFSVDLTIATILVLYLLTSPFCWERTHITAYTSTRGAVNWVFILIVVRTCGKYISEINIAIMACVSNCLFLLFIGVGYSDAMIYAGAVMGILSAATPPMMRSVMSRLVGPDEQGALFATVSAVEVMATAVLGVVMTLIYRASLSFFPGLIFVILAAFDLVTLVLLGYMSYVLKKEAAEDKQSLTVEPREPLDQKGMRRLADE